jgi:hypothetical protein
MADTPDRRAREDTVLNLVKTSKDSRGVLLDKTADALHENFSHYTGVYLSGCQFSQRSNQCGDEPNIRDFA